MASVGYQGSLTKNQTQHYNLYNPGAAQGYALNPVVHGITYYANDGHGRFNALLLELKHPFGNQFTLDTQYRLSHAMDSGSNAYAGGFYQWDMNTNSGTADFDSWHAFKLFGTYSPTIFSGDRSSMEKLLGGWTISGILNAQSGFPWTPLCNFQGAQNVSLFKDDGTPCLNLANQTGCKIHDPVYNFGPGSGGSSGNAGTNTMLPAAYLGGFNPNYGSNQTVDAKASFQDPNVPLGTLFDCLFANPGPGLCPNGQQPFGGLPSYPGVKGNSFYGPGYFSVDATLSKSFGLPNIKGI